MNATLSRRLPWLVLLAAGLTSALLLWTRRDYVPLFDGRIYADCIAQVSWNPRDPWGYRCAGHISESYVAFVAFVMWLAPKTDGSILVANALLLAIGAAALWRILGRAFPGEEHAVGRALVTGAFVVHPIVLASVVQPGLDIGLLVYSLCALAAAVEGRRWLLVLAGIPLIFAKEPGVVLYGLIVGAWLWRAWSPYLSSDMPRVLAIAGVALLLLFSPMAGALATAVLFAFVLAGIVFAPRPAARAALPGLVRAVLREWPLALPVLVLAAYMVAYKLHAARLAAAGATVQGGVIWGKEGASDLFLTLFRPGVFDLPTRSAFALMFIVGFLWIPSMLVLIDLVVGILRRARGHAPRAVPGADASTIGVVVMVLVADIWMLSRFVTYSNARYYLPVFPLMLIAAYAAAVRLRVPARARAAAGAVLIALLAVSAVRTVDPVSRGLWGTWQMGERSLLSVTSLTGECCGHGRDQLAYNLEFTELATLQDSLYQRIRPTERTLLIVPWMGNWRTVERVDTVTYRRTLWEGRSVYPQILEADSAMFRGIAVPTAWYVELPFTKDTFFRDQLARTYDFGAPCEVTRNGYALSARPMRLRAANVASPSSTAPAPNGFPASACGPPAIALPTR